ncbi:hypothetical protein AAMO2058_000054400 [Amorphochlora amoebiformis]
MSRLLEKLVEEKCLAENSPIGFLQDFGTTSYDISTGLIGDILANFYFDDRPAFIVLIIPAKLASQEIRIFDSHKTGRGRRKSTMALPIIGKEEDEGNKSQSVLTSVQLRGVHESESNLASTVSSMEDEVFSMASTSVQGLTRQDLVDMLTIPVDAKDRNEFIDYILSCARTYLLPSMMSIQTVSKSFDTKEGFPDLVSPSQMPTPRMEKSPKSEKDRDSEGSTSLDVLLGSSEGKPRFQPHTSPRSTYLGLSSSPEKTGTRGSAEFHPPNLMNKSEPSSELLPSLGITPFRLSSPKPREKKLTFAPKKRRSVPVVQRKTALVTKRFSSPMPEVESDNSNNKKKSSTNSPEHKLNKIQVFEPRKSKAPVQKYRFPLEDSMGLGMDGSIVIDVLPGSQAEKMGIKKDWTLVKVEGSKITEDISTSEVSRIFQTRKEEAKKAGKDTIEVYFKEDIPWGLSLINEYPRALSSGSSKRSYASQYMEPLKLKRRTRFGSRIRWLHVLNFVFYISKKKLSEEDLRLFSRDSDIEDLYQTRRQKITIIPFGIVVDVIIQKRNIVIKTFASKVVFSPASKTVEPSDLIQKILKLKNYFDQNPSLIDNNLSQVPPIS